MNADYYNAEPGFRSIDQMFWELEDARENDENGNVEIADIFDGSYGPFAAETSDDIDDAYERERERDWDYDDD